MRVEWLSLKRWSITQLNFPPTIGNLPLPLILIMQPVRNQFELLKVSTNGSLPLPSPAGAGERKQVVVAGGGRAAVVTGA